MKLNNILQMIEQTEVEWKTLGEVAEIQRGKIITAKSATVGEIPVISGGQKPAYFTGDFNRDGETITIAGSGAYAGFVMYWNEPIFVGDAFSIKPNDNLLLTKYVYHFLLSNQTKIFGMKKGSGVPHVYPKDVAVLQIPVPPLYLQKEIVKVLDKLTELKATLKATLKAELSLREKQYHYYRDHLLTFGDEVEWKTLKDVALDFGRGKSKHRPRNDVRLYGGDIPFIQTGDIRNSSHLIEDYSQTYSDFGLQQSKLWGKGTLCITIAANIAETGILNFDACFPDSIIGFVADPNQTNEHYVEYLLSSFKTKLQSQSTGSAQENINLSTFDNLLLPFPPLESQQKIVAILDKFERLTHSITEGLPKEIELRCKQYEYYREKLLSFSKV